MKNSVELIKLGESTLIPTTHFVYKCSRTVSNLDVLLVQLN